MADLLGLMIPNSNDVFTRAITVITQKTLKFIATYNYTVLLYYTCHNYIEHDYTYIITDY